ncbi:hypothetical protein E3P99_02225 [Wallemia hederae]|uniref:Uncharacterized protein n=1 Tax=Wallemia hederae TaxID=1540922 RepID=A0A4T0FKP8_9BASI|nr:hypothetical protein E3P99_02225 [Wallemia hederae]
MNQASHASQVIKPVSLSQVDVSSIPEAYRAGKKAVQQEKERIVDVFIAKQANNELPANLLVRRDGGRAANDGIKTEVREELRKYMRTL